MDNEYDNRVTATLSLRLLNRLVESGVLTEVDYYDLRFPAESELEKAEAA